MASYATHLPQIDEKNWEIIRAKMFGLQDALRLSPDLTPKQATALFLQYKNELLEIKASKNLLGDLESFSEMEDWEKDAMDVLNM